MPQGAHSLGRERERRPRAAAALLGELSPPRLLALAASLAFATAACDQGTQHDQPTSGPPLHVVGTNVDPSKPFPANGSIQIAFDRLIHPATVVRQSFLLSGNVVPTIQYDPVTRIVSMSTASGSSGQAWLTPGQTYQLTLPVPDPGQLNSGPRAIDGATLSSPYTLEFIAGPTDPAVSVTDGKVDFCADVLPIFHTRCNGSSCHGTGAGGARSAEALFLQTSDGVANTAIGRVSQESNTGAQAGLGLPASRLFGVDMPIIDPHSPGNSWLMYKLLLAVTRPIDAALDAGVSTCGAAAAPPTPGLLTSTSFAVPLSDDERTRLSQFILGSPMPLQLHLADDEPTPNNAALPCTFDEMERIRAWIQAGAGYSQCDLCPFSNQ